MSVLPAARRAGLVARYREPHRAYHTLAHIEALLAASHAAPDRAEDRAAMELAIWYHDAIYDPASRSNETDSAVLLRAELAGVIAPPTLDAACRLIELTASHELPPDLPSTFRRDAAWFLDLDMAILGAPAPEYDAYERGIAAEYEPVHGAAAYRAGRLAFLQGQLGRPRLFHTDDLHARLDPVARDNIRRAIAALTD